MEIKEVFNSKEELNDCLKWWQEKLFLTDWIIKARISEPCDFINENVLVHELLHCKYNWLANESFYEGKYVDVMEHGLLEQMAKSLIMAKYDLILDYFNDTEVE